MTDTGQHRDDTRATRSVRRTLDEVFRREHARVLSVLVRDLGDLDLAEEALSDAMAQAVEAWAVHDDPYDVSETAMARRLGRARRKIRDANIPYRVPAAHGRCRAAGPARAPGQGCVGPRHDP